VKQQLSAAPVRHGGIQEPGLGNVVSLAQRIARIHAVVIRPTEAFWGSASMRVVLTDWVCLNLAPVPHPGSLKTELTSYRATPIRYPARVDGLSSDQTIISCWISLLCNSTSLLHLYDLRSTQSQYFLSHPTGWAAFIPYLHCWTIF
jgi:hypothetical protein